jgi:hypothetical protein
LTEVTRNCGRFCELDMLPAAGELGDAAVEPALLFDSEPVTSTRFPTRLLSSVELPVKR